MQVVIVKIQDRLIVPLPGRLSQKLPSRGVASGEVTLGETKTLVVLEPDGRGSHWFALDQVFPQKPPLREGEVIDLEIEPSGDWLEPPVPRDFMDQLKRKQEIYSLWQDISPLARWDWVRWIRSTKQEKTREKRILAALDKMAHGERRPCCFNRNLCTVPELSRGGQLLKPEET